MQPAERERKLDEEEKKDETANQSEVVEPTEEQPEQKLDEEEKMKLKIKVMLCSLLNQNVKLMKRKKYQMAVKCNRLMVSL